MRLAEDGLVSEFYCATIAPMGTADSTYVPGIGVGAAQSVAKPRYSALVRVTHWITALSFFGLLVSGFAILLAHPRFYWGETGGVGMPSLFDLPLPFVLVGQTGWGRHLHFLSAWMCVLTGVLYVLSGVFTRHFRDELLPKRPDLALGSVIDAVRNQVRGKVVPVDRGYNLPQRIAYLTVIFVLFPLAILTGFSMSPAITSVIPEVVTVFGGQQSARTIHFFAANLLVLFVVVHLVMVFLAGFSGRVGAMVTGGAAARKERS